MTSTATQQQQQPATAARDAAVRKRRRRAPAGGAADDCFACAKRAVKCDRRRPYCSQCLEIGNECSGYKTQLTWGVGVASRGKLRGLSLPVAKAPPVGSASGKKTSPPRSRASSAAANGHWSDQDEAPTRSRLILGAGAGAGAGGARDDVDLSPEHASAPPTPFHGGGASYDYLSVSQPDRTPPMVQGGSWGSLPYQQGGGGGGIVIPADGPKYQKLGAHLAPIPITDVLSSSLESVSDIDYMSPMSQSFSRDDMQYMGSPTLMYDSYTTGNSSPVPQSPTSGVVMDHRAPTSCPSLIYAPSEPSSSLASHMDSFEAQLSQKLMRECDSLSVPELDAYSTSCNSGPVWASPHDDDLASHHSDQQLQQQSHQQLQHRQSPSRWPSLFESQPVQVSAELVSRMPFFMDYYKNTMCPSMVFIDGPHNPFRDHVLQLASGSQSLQHALCALSACNLRMRRRLSLGQDTRELSDKIKAEKTAGDALEGRLDDQSVSEEYQHRNLAVHMLNQQLNDPAKSTHDSVLATILILCHYRMVESGIAKFHTQFAGVKKILAMRRSQKQQQQQQQAPSGDSAWMEAIFTYFDAVSASINDREAQLGSSSSSSFHGLVPDAQLLPLGAENLVGCDRELFRTISKLGRLNLLSQHRPVQGVVASSSSPLPRNIPSRSQSPLGSPLGHAYKGSLGGIGSMHHQHQHQHQHHHQHSHQLGDLYGMPGGGGGGRFDGNGFGTTLDDDEMMASAVCSSASYDDHRSLFWREWKEARAALQGWDFDASRLHASLPCAPTQAQVRDLGSLSEAFRYAALLYTERLASPNVPSSATNFQNLVSQVVYYATSLEAGSGADKFLLWPLFVAGSECVNELQQGIVRSKCRDIMSRSGYMNNLAALDVLERLWAGDWQDPELEPRSPAAKLGGTRRGPFNWTRCIGGPGVEVEWIMF